MIYKEGYIKNEQLKFRNEKVIDQNKLTSDCWLIQLNGIKACTNCEFNGTKQCGGKKIIKQLQNENT